MRLGKYEIVRELARGGMGAVYIARQPGLEREVALKVVLNADAKRVARFAVEAQATARLRHPNVVAIHEVGMEQGYPYLVMDLIRGESLKAKIQREGPLPLLEVARIGEKLAWALEHAHGESILHRDMKPSNVLISREGEPLITDFGLARIVGAEAAKLTKTGQLIGTPAYMPPEQVEGERDDVDRRSDVYSLGATLYEMLTGRPPFEGDLALNVVVAVVRQPPTPPSELRSGVDPELERIVLKCLEKKRDQRYPTAAALAEELTRWQQVQSGEVEPAAVALPAPEPQGLRVGLAGLVMAGLLLAVLLVGLLVTAFVAKQARSGYLLRDAESEGVALVEQDPQRALELLQRAAKLDPEGFRAWKALARAAAAAGDAEAARAALERIPPAGMTKGERRYLQGLLAGGSTRLALAHFQAAWSLGYQGRHFAVRLRELRRSYYERKGWTLSREELLFEEMRTVPVMAPTAVETILQWRLQARDVAGLVGLRDEVRRRVGEEALGRRVSPILGVLAAAPFMTGADSVWIQTSVRNLHAPWARECLPLLVLVATTRRGGPSLSRARVWLRALVAGASPTAKQISVEALGAFQVLTGVRAKHAEGALLLAERVLELPRARPELRGSYRASLKRAAAGKPSPQLQLALARSAVEDGQLAEAAAAVTRALALRRDWLPALELEWQLAILAGQPGPHSFAKVSQKLDPALIMAASYRLNFARRYRAIVLPGPNGAWRVVIHLRGQPHPALSRGEPGGTAAARATLRTPFSFAPWHSVRIEGKGALGRLAVGGWDLQPGVFSREVEVTVRGRTARVAVDGAAPERQVRLAPGKDSGGRLSLAGVRKPGVVRLILVGRWDQSVEPPDPSVRRRDR